MLNILVYVNRRTKSEIPPQIAGLDTKPAHVLAVMDQSELSVAIPGKPATVVHAGEAIWLPAGTAAALLNQSKGNARFFVLTFKDSVPM